MRRPCRDGDPPATMRAAYPESITHPMTEAPAEQPHPRTLAESRKAIVVVDLVESVRLIQQHELDVVDRWTRFVGDIRQHTLPARGGEMVKSLGDGLLLVFEHAPSAAAAALEMHQRMAPFNAQRAPEAQLLLRVGVHTGRVLQDANDIYGEAVNLAARLTALAAPGETVVSAEVRDALVPGVDADPEDLGDCHVKHVEGAVRVYRLGAAPASPLLDSLQQRRQAELRPGLAVIPFECHFGHDPGDMLGEALADEVISQLARCAELHVVSALSTRGLKGRRLGVQEVAGHLGAAYVLSGRYRMLGDRAHLMLELADVRNARLVWAETYQTSAHQAFDPADPLAERIVAQVSLAVLERELERAATYPLPALESYTLLLGAISLMHRLSLADFERAHQMLQQLAHRHPRNAIAHAWLAKWHVLRAVQGWGADQPTEAQLALDRVGRALDANPRHALALSIGGLVHAYLRRDLTQAGVFYERAREASPNEPLAWLFTSNWYAYHGQGPEAESAADKALRLSPLDPMKYFFDSLAATALLANGNWQGSEALSLRSVRANRTHASTWRTLAYALVMQGKMDQAREAVNQLRAVEPSYTLRSFWVRFPGREGPLAAPWAQALAAAGLPE